MSREDFDNAIYFVGPEVIHTAAFSLKTLYVVGYRSVVQMLEYVKEYDCKAVYIGARGSFQNNKLWNNVIPELLSNGLKVTVDYPSTSHSFLLDVLDDDIWKHPNFIPLVTCRIPNVETSSKNLVLKVSDKDFNDTNRGVWSIPKHDLLDNNRFTSWGDFNHDIVVLKEEKKAVKKKK